MKASSVSRFNRVSMKKMQKIVQLIRSMSYIDAVDSLLFCPQKSAKILRSMLKNAGANLQNKSANSDQKNWGIESIILSRGSYYKRINPRARGQADTIRKPTTHVKVIISEK